MAVRVVAPDGTAWVVRRRWMPGRDTSSLWDRFRRRVRHVGRRARGAGEGLDAAADGAELLGGTVAALVAAVAVVLLLVFVVVPLLLALAEVAALLVVAGLILMARVVLRRPWVVEAVPDAGVVQRWDLVGWQASGAACLAVAQRLEAGILPPPGEAPT